MKPPTWLAELHRQWQTARGKHFQPKQRGFSRPWNKLLDAAGIVSAEDRKDAERELRKLADQGRLKIKTLRYRIYLIESITLPIDQEPWLLSLFDQKSPAQLLGESLAILDEAMKSPHPRFPEMWDQWCIHIRTSFAKGKSLGALNWRTPGQVRFLMTIVHKLTSKVWEEGTMIREASVAIDLDSKALERKRRVVESCLSSMFGRSMRLQSMGFVMTDSRADLAGLLSLHFPDGSIQTFDNVKAVFAVSHADLERAKYATTSASRLLTVENAKTTLRRLAERNIDGETLLAACSFPTKALLRLVKLLPETFPIFHFGDTDPAGFDILLKLRKETGRKVWPFLMKRREAKAPKPLTEYDRAILPRLLSDLELEDIHSELIPALEQGDKGDFEQETLGPPSLYGWPFYAADSPVLTAEESRQIQRLLTEPVLAEVREPLALMLAAGRKGRFEQESLGPPEGDWPFYPEPDSTASARSHNTG